MSSFSDRCAHEDEQDRLALVNDRYKWEVVGPSDRTVYTCMTEVAADAYAAMHWAWTYRPLVPYDVATDWRERA